MANIVLQTEGLTKRYGSLVAVNNLSLQVYEGEVFGFLGPNGAGKTTSINMLVGLLRPDSGWVHIHGTPIAGRDPNLRARIGVCPQDIVLWDRLTCLEQLNFVGRMYALPSHFIRRRSEQLLQDLNLQAKRNQQARTLSGGLKRRLNFALALIHDPEIVVLDEPESGLDPQSRILVREYIRTLAQHKTIILTTHNMDEADRLADRVAIIDHGSLLVTDSPEALKRSVGEGDVVEIHLQGQAVDSETILGRVKELMDQASFHLAQNTLTVRALNAVNLLPKLVDKLSGMGLRCGEVRVRQNTLEDVFIQLTGRRLRQ